MENKQPQEIDLLKLAAVLLSKIWLILLVTVIFAIVSFGYTKYLVTPKYTATSKLYVYNSSEKTTLGHVSSSDISTSKILVDTYIVILESDSVLNQVCERIKECQELGEEGYEYFYGKVYTPDILRKMISASSINNTESFQIVVTATDPYEAKSINDGILYFLPNEIIRVVKAGAVEIIDYASVPTEPSSPNIMRNTAIGAILGFVFICGTIVVFSLLDMHIHSKDDLAESFKDIPILGVIPSYPVMSQKTVSTTKNEKKADVDDDDWDDEE